MFTLSHCFIFYSLFSFSNPVPQSKPPQCPLAPLAGYLHEPCTLTRLSWPGQSPLSCSAGSHWRGCWLRVSLGGCSSSPRCRPCLQRSVTQERQFFEISEWRSHIFPVAFLDESDIGSTGCASASGRQHAFFLPFFFSLWGALRMENSATSCPDVNYWCRVRLTNSAKQPQRRRNHAAADGRVYKQALRSVRRPPSVFLSTHWSCMKLLFLPTTLKSAVKFPRVFSQSRGPHLRCHVDQFIHFQFLSFITFQKVQETACERNRRYSEKRLWAVESTHLETLKLFIIYSFQFSPNNGIYKIWKKWRILHKI